MTAVADPAPALAAILATAAEVLRLASAALPRPWQPCGAQPKAGCVCRLVWSVPADCTVAQALGDEGGSGRPEDVLYIVAAGNAAETLAAFVVAAGPALAEWMAAEREERDALEAWRGGPPPMGRDALVESHRRSSAADAALFAALAGLVAP